MICQRDLVSSLRSNKLEVYDELQQTQVDNYRSLNDVQDYYKHKIRKSWQHLLGADLRFGGTHSANEYAIDDAAALLATLELYWKCTRNMAVKLTRRFSASANPP